MRIIIVGAGKLGYTIAERLSQEEYDVVVVDNNPARLQIIQDNLDVLTIEANGSSPITMNNDDIRDADVLIAVTATDEVNMVSCILAKKHGIKRTIARIRDMQFISEAKEYLKANFDIDLMLNPELIMAMEINRILMVPAALNIEDFADGQVRLFETKVKKKSPLANIMLKDLSMPKTIIAAMIFRGQRMIIPHGDDSLQPNDNAYFIGLTTDIDKFSKNLEERNNSKLDKVTVIGAGRMGRFVASMLDRQHVKVKIFDTKKDRLHLIASQFENNGKAIWADAADINKLLEEGINETDALICLTDDDKLNFILALLGKHHGVKKTIIRQAKTDYKSILRELGVDISLSSRILAANEVLAFVRGNSAVSLLQDARAEVTEVVIQTGSPVCNKRLMEASLPKSCLVCAFVKNGEVQIPNGNTVLKAGGRAIIITEKQSTKKILKYFSRN
ncbi:Trk system potassium transporter TrkA [Anaerovibrio sp.]|uniref:Trk system potassium transporter TrkA n=1 Tax=Anaerovibrio sp. TaxID=1872532 RepID=UPI0025C04ABC|nr:Trk system potassium transporter TrkA [Anaerovibrio sp.]MBR2143072.1 Trk system potassium transporter TrkA [Anaerovibrio sp.]